MQKDPWDRFYGLIRGEAGRTKKYILPEEEKMKILGYLFSSH